MSYREWNTTLFKHFFNEEHYQEPVILYLDRNLIDNVGKKKGGFKAFIESITVRDGELKHIVDTFQSSLNDDTIHVCENDYVPSYFSILCLTILAWTIDDSLNAANYYDRLNTLLIEGYSSFLNTLELEPDTMRSIRQGLGELSIGQGLNQSLDSKFRGQIESSFKRLERYTKKIRHGEVGFYEFRRAGQRYVDIPKAHALINAKDRKSLKKFFFDRVITPGTVLTPNEAYSVLTSGGLDQLTNATRGRWNENNSNKQIMAEIVCSLIKHWDGNYEEERLNTAFPDSNNILAGAYLWPILETDLLGTNYKLKSRIEFLNKDFPVEQSVYFRIRNHELTTIRQFAGWSNQIELDLDEWEWLFNSNENKIITSGQEYRIRFPSKLIFIFESSPELGGYIPVNELIEQQDYLILINAIKHKKFINQNIEFLNEIGLTPQIKGWKLFKVKNNYILTEITTIRQRNENIPFELIGGVKLGHGNRNNFAELIPPKIKLKSKLPENYSVSCIHGMTDVQLLEQVPYESNLYHLPEITQPFGTYEVFISDENFNRIERYQTITLSLIECVIPNFQDFEGLSTGFKPVPDNITPFLYENESLELLLGGENRLNINTPSFLNSEQFSNPIIRFSKNLIGLNLACDSVNLSASNNDDGSYNLPDLNNGGHDLSVKWHGIELLQEHIELFPCPQISISVSGGEQAESPNHELWFLHDLEKKPVIKLTIQDLTGPQLEIFLNGSRGASTREDTFIIEPPVGKFFTLELRWGGINLTKQNYIFSHRPIVSVSLSENSGKKWPGSQVFMPDHPPIIDLYFKISTNEPTQENCRIQCFVGRTQLSFEKRMNEIISYKLPSGRAPIGENLPIKVKYCGVWAHLKKRLYLDIIDKPQGDIVLIGREVSENTFISNHLPRIQLELRDHRYVDPNSIRLKCGNKFFEKSNDDSYQVPSNLYPQNDGEKDIEIKAYWYDQEITAKTIKIIDPESSSIEFLGGEAITAGKNVFLKENCPNQVRIKTETQVTGLTILFGPDWEDLKSIDGSVGETINLGNFEKAEGKEYIIELWRGDIKENSSRFLLAGPNWMKLGFFKGNIDLLKNNTPWVPCWYVEKLGKRGYKIYPSDHCQYCQTKTVSCPCNVIQPESQPLVGDKKQKKKWEKIVHHSKIHMGDNLINIWEIFKSGKRS